MADPEEIWLPLVDEPVGDIVAQIQAEDPEIDRLVGSPHRILAFRTFSYIRVGILLGELLFEQDLAAEDADENWIEALLRDPKHHEALHREVRAVAEEIAADPKYADEGHSGLTTPLASDSGISRGSSLQATRTCLVSAGAAAPDEFYDAYSFDVEPRSYWTRARRRFVRHRLAVASLLVLTFIFAAGFLARYLAPYPYMQPNVDALGMAPSWAHPFGTDLYGRDSFSSVLYALGTEARIALFVGLIGTLIGTIVGTVAGYFGGVVDTVLMRFSDLLLTLPALVVVIVAAAYLHATTPLKVALVLAGLLSTPVARVVRGTCLSLREKEYVEAARAVGASDLRIMARHILPNAIGSVAVAATLMTAGAIVLEVTLSYLGFGIADFTVGAPKRTPSLGHVMAQANDEGLFHWWGLTFPGLTIVLIVMSINFIGDGLRDALDPNQRLPGRWRASKR